MTIDGLTQTILDNRHFGDGFHVVNHDGQVIQCSRGLADMLGFGPEQLDGHHIREWDQEGRVQELLADQVAADSNGILTLQTLFRHRLGVSIQVELNIIVVRLSGQRLLLINATNLEQPLSQSPDSESDSSEERYRLLLNNSPVGILHYDCDLIVTYANARFEAIMQVPRGHMTGLDCHQLQDQSVVPPMAQALSGVHSRYEGPYHTSYSQLDLWISMACAPVRDATGKILGGIVILEDITQRKRIERELSQFKFFSENAGDALILLDETTRIRYANKTACRQLGYSEAELTQLSVPDIDPHYGREQVLAHFEAAKQRPMPPFESQHRRKDGTVIDVEVMATAVCLDGEWLSFTASRDISERKRIQAKERRQRESFAALNHIAALSHLPLHEQFEQALALIGQQLQLPFAIVSQVKGQEYRVYAHLSPPETLEDGQTFELGNTYCDITLKEQRVVAIDRMGTSDYKGHPCYQAFKLEAYIGAPIFVGNQVYGTVNFSSAEPYCRRFDESDLEFVSLLARWAGSAIERDQAQKRLVASESHLKAVIQNEPECVQVVDPDNRVLQINQAGLRFFEVNSLEEVNTKGLINFIDPLYRDAFLDLQRRVLAGESDTLEFVVDGKQGYRRWLDTHATPFRNAEGDIVAVLSVTRDITDEKRADSQLRLAASVFSHAHEGIMICDDDQVIIDVNPTFTEITGYQRHEVIGRRPTFLRGGEQGQDFYQAMWQAIRSQGHWEGELWNRRKDGQRFAERLTISTVRDDKGAATHYIGTFSDITLVKEQQERLQFLAHYDPLTRLPNRTLLSDRMNQALAHSARNGTFLAVCYLDLDGFKAINDTLGHDAGDELLVQIAERLNNTVRGGDTVARLGGDEFVILLVGNRAPSEYQHAARRMLEAIAAPVFINERPYHVSGSIGVTLYPQDENDPDTLLRHADQAMYTAKQSGKNCFRLHSAAGVQQVTTGKAAG